MNQILQILSDTVGYTRQVTWYLVSYNFLGLCIPLCLQDWSNPQQVIPFHLIHRIWKANPISAKKYRSCIRWRVEREKKRKSFFFFWVRGGVERERVLTWIGLSCWIAFFNVLVCSAANLVLLTPDKTFSCSFLFCSFWFFLSKFSVGTWAFRYLGLAVISIKFQNLEGFIV